MAQCPECGGRIGYWTLSAHAAFSPIMCRECGAIVYFDTRSWLRIVSPALVTILALFLCTFFGGRTLWIQVPLAGLLLAFLVKIMFDVRKVKVVTKGKETVQPSSRPVPK